MLCLDSLLPAALLVISAPLVIFLGVLLPELHIVVVRGLLEWNISGYSHSQVDLLLFHKIAGLTTK